MTTTALQTFWPASGVGLHITGPGSTPLITVDGNDMPSTDLTPESALRLAADLTHAVLVTGHQMPAGSEVVRELRERLAQLVPGDVV